MLLPIVVATAAIVGALWVASLHARRPRHALKLPPGPPSFPIIGNFHTLGTHPHAALRSLARTYGPLMTLWQGFVPVIVVSSPEAAEAVYKTHDAAFSGRPKNQVAGYFSYGYKGIVFAGYGHHWRYVRRLCTSNLLSPSKIATYSGVRREEMDSFVERMREDAAARRTVNLSERVPELIESIICRVIIGRNAEDSSELNKVIRESLFLAGVFNIGDGLPILQPFDFQGILRRLKAATAKFECIMDGIFAEHTSGERKGKEADFVDEMLSLENQAVGSGDGQRMDRTKIKALVKELIAGGVDTTVTAAEWVIAEIIRHPRVAAEVRKELRSVVGMERQVEEADLPRLPYLEMVIKEGLRLHPAGALSVPRECIEDVTMNGYHIPSGSKVVVNIWAMGRDRRVWSDNAEEFIPERFKGEKVDVLGQDFRILPFGSGRRVCPGAKMGFLSLRLIVAHLFHCFDMEVAEGETAETLDMSELPGGGLSTARARPLIVLPTDRFNK